MSITAYKVEAVGYDRIGDDFGLLEDHAEFLIYEGANAVGKGRVLSRTVPYKLKQQRK